MASITPSAAALDACRAFDVDPAEFVDAIPPRFIEEAAIYLAGSLPEGFGNSSSDLDVMIVSRLPLQDVDYVIRKDLMLIQMIHGRSRRIDLEFIHTDVIEAPLREISALDIPVDFVAERIDERQELLIHRLLRSIPLYDMPAYTRLLGMARDCDFRHYMVKRCLHKIDGAALDLEGMLRRGDPAEVMLRLLEVVDHTIDALRFSAGYTNPLTKWRVRSLRAMPAMPATPENARTLDMYLRYRVFGLGLNDPDLDQIGAQVSHVLYWSDCALRTVYD